MKKQIGVLVSLLVLFSAVAAFGASGGAGKIGFVDLQSIQGKSRWGDMIRQEVKRYKDKTQAEVEPKLKAIKEKGDEFEKKRANSEQAKQYEKEGGGIHVAVRNFEKPTIAMIRAMKLEASRW